MHREYHRWHSPSLGRDMELLLFGRGGAKVVVFPTSQSRFTEWESRGLIHGVLREPVERGFITVCCVDSVDSESWYARWKHPADRALRQADYENYVLREVLPLMDDANPTPFTIVTGASLGGYHALDFGLRHPQRVNRILSMSGVCDMRGFCDGWYGQELYFHNPVDFIAGEYDHQRLESLRRQDVIMAIGRNDYPWLRDSNQRLTTALWSKGAGNALRWWDGQAHDWPVWEKMLHLYLNGHD